MCNSMIQMRSKPFGSSESWKASGNGGRSQYESQLKILCVEQWEPQIPTSVMRQHASPSPTKTLNQGLQIGMLNTEKGGMWCLAENWRIKFYTHNKQWHCGALGLPRFSTLKTNVIPSKQEVEGSSFWEFFQNKNLQKFTSGWKSVLTISMISNSL